jgi:undecaprenyl-diphosphatase
LAGFGVLSLAVVLCLAAVLILAAWLARHPREPPLATLRHSSVGQWVGEHFGTPARTLANRLSVDVVAAVGLLLGLGVVAALGLAFAKVLDDVLEGDGVNGLDDPAARWLATHRDLWLSNAMKAVTHLGDSPVIAAAGLAIALFVAGRSHRWLPAVLGAVGIAGIGLMIFIAKTAVGRSRPASPFALVVENGYSFPSGHATGTAAIALLCGWIVTRWLVHGWAARVAVWAADRGNRVLPRLPRRAPPQRRAGRVAAGGGMGRNCDRGGRLVGHRTPHPARLIVDQGQRQPRAALHSLSGELAGVGRHLRLAGLAAWQRISPVVAGQKVGEQFGAQPATLAAGPVDVQSRHDGQPQRVT